MSPLFASGGQSIWSFSFSISPSNEYSGLISFRIDWFDFLAVQGTLKSLNQHYNMKASILQCTAFFTVQLSHPYTITRNTIALTTWMFVGKVMSVCSISPTNVLLNPTVKGGFSGGTVVKKKKPICKCRRPKKYGFNPWIGKIPWRRKWQATPVFLPGKPHGQRNLVGYSPWSHNGLDTTDHAQPWKRDRNCRSLTYLNIDLVKQVFSYAFFLIMQLAKGSKIA